MYLCIYPWMYVCINPSVFLSTSIGSVPSRLMRISISINRVSTSGQLDTNDLAWVTRGVIRSLGLGRCQARSSTEQAGRRQGHQWPAAAVLHPHVHVLSHFLNDAIVCLR